MKALSYLYICGRHLFDALTDLYRSQKNTYLLVWDDYMGEKVLRVKGWTVGILDKEGKSHRAANRGPLK